MSYTRPKDWLIQGFYCPLPPPKLVGTRLRRGIYVLTALGLEMRCSRCHEYYPADTEFFFGQAGKQGGLHAWCRACYMEHRHPARYGLPVQVAA